VSAAAAPQPSSAVSPTVQRIRALGKRLNALIAQPQPTHRWRVEDWIAFGGRTLLIADKKAGKSTLMANFIRSLLDGADFLDDAPVQPLAHDESVVLVDFEMSETDLQLWYRDQGIRNQSRAVVFALDGEETLFHILDTNTRDAWVHELRALNCKVLIVDCAGPALAACNLNENTDMPRFCVALNQLKRSANVSEVVLVHHTGHTDKKRPRGHSYLLGWHTTQIVVESNSSGQRWISASGRDVDQPQRELIHDDTTRRLTLGSMPLSAKGSASGRLTKVKDLALQVLKAVHPQGMNPRQVHLELVDCYH
jgi:hypothetical protein